MGKAVWGRFRVDFRSVTEVIAVLRHRGETKNN
jgi:hypothetical protein